VARGRGLPRGLHVLTSENRVTLRGACHIALRAGLQARRQSDPVILKGRLSVTASGHRQLALDYEETLICASGSSSRPITDIAAHVHSGNLPPGPLVYMHYITCPSL
jgi:hypothetical protein